MKQRIEMKQHASNNVHQIRAIFQFPPPPRLALKWRQCYACITLSCAENIPRFIK